MWRTGLKNNFMAASNKQNHGATSPTSPNTRYRVGIHVRAAACTLCLIRPSEAAAEVGGMLTLLLTAVVSGLMLLGIHYNPPADALPSSGSAAKQKRKKL